MNGVGYGKIILLGEHFVVHGASAIAGGLSNTAVVEIKKSDKNMMLTEQVVVPENGIAAMERILKSMEISQNYQATLTGNLPTYGGLGSSAAFCVGVVRAIAAENMLRLKDDEVNKHAYEGEKAFHGNPSGIDNIMATYGGLIEFKRGKEKPDFKKLSISKPIDFVVTFTGKYSPTSKMVALVQKLKDDDPEQFAELFDEYLEIFKDGKHCLEKGKLQELGKLMNANHSLLSELGVSDELNEKINKIALGSGALGAKVTGGGGGGCSIALAKDSEHAQKIAEVLNKNKFHSFCTKIG
ncbi:mevalonate kinase [Candidatus Micrarchaeota archaeon]|nr:mevalonate kinase [Candidatus Micrarchaeota archaeon]